MPVPTCRLQAMSGVGTVIAMLRVLAEHVVLELAEIGESQLAIGAVVDVMLRCHGQIVVSRTEQGAEATVPSCR